MLAKDGLTKCAGGSFSLRTTKTKYTIISQKEVSLIFVVFVTIMKSFNNISEHKFQFIRKKIKNAKLYHEYDTIIKSSSLS